MSRAYQIRVSESLDRVEHIEDGVTCRLELLGVLPPEQMREHLRAALVARGFVEVEGEAEVLELPAEDGIEVQVDLRAGALSVRIEGEARVAAERSVDRRVTNPERDRAGVEEEVRAELEREAARQADVARQGLTRQLEDRLLEVRPLVDRAVNEATAEALKVRAAQLGEVESVEEDPEAGSLVIRVKL